MTLFNNQMNNVKLNQVSEQLAQIVQQTINVLHPPSPAVGCKGDGVTDDTTALQNLINTYSALFIPYNANIRVTAQINLVNNTFIYGQGTIFTDAGTTDNGVNVLVGTEVTNIVIEGITVKGNVYGQAIPPTGSFAGMGVPILLIGCKNIRIQNTYVTKGGGYTTKNQGVGDIYLSCCKDAVINGNTVESCQNGIVVDDWYSYATGKSGFYTQNISITGNTVNDGCGRGIVIDTNVGQVTGGQNPVSVIGNTIRNMPYSGIDLKGSSYSVVANNTIDCTSLNRTFDNNDIPTYYGIEVDVGTNNSVITGNTITGAWRMGILLARPNNITVSNNVVKMDLNKNDTNPKCIGITTVANQVHGTIKILDNTLENLGVNATAGTCFNVDMTNANNIINLFVKGNDFHGKGTGINTTGGTNQIKYALIEGNTFNDGSAYSLVALYLDFVDTLSVKNNIASNIARFVILSGSTLAQFSHNQLIVVSFPYQFKGTINNLVLGDTYLGSVTGVIFDTSNNPTISSSDGSAQKFLGIDFTKVKNGTHPQNLQMNAGSALTGGYWAVGDKNTLTPVASGNIGQVCVTAGTPGTWKNYGNISA